MSDIARHIRSIDAPADDATALSTGAASTTQLVAPPLPMGEEPSVFETLPWLWIAAWLIGWGLIVAIAAWYIGNAPRSIWAWIVVWAIPGLAVSALLTRVAVQASEREAAAMRLRRAGSDIAKLEERLRLSSQSMFSATQTLADATQLLLEQVDTSRDDLRNQIGSAQQLADSLKDQTHALVSAQTGLRKTLLGEDDVADPVKDDVNSDAVEEAQFVQPPLGLRPAPQEAPPVFETQPTPDVATTWKWSDMLRSVDGALPELADAEVEDAPDTDIRDDVIAMLVREGLSPSAIVSDGTVQDVSGLWQRQGVGAMMKVLELRIKEPADMLAQHLRADSADAALAMDYVASFKADLPADAAAREDTLMAEDGRAWLIVKAAVARLEASGA